MRVYAEVARRTIGRMTTYRGATVAGVFTNTVFGFLLAYVLLGVFRERPLVGGFDATDAVTFTFVAQGLIVAVGLFLNTSEIAERIRSGDVASDLARPVDFQAWWASVAYGEAAYLLVCRGIPPVVLAGMVFHLRMPGATVWPAFLLSVLLAVGVGFGVRFLVSLSSFWLLDTRGPTSLVGLAAGFLSGMYIPLVLFPDWLAAVARALPFASMLQLPVEVFLGKHSGAGLLAVLATQAAWAAVLVLAGRIVLGRAVRRLVVQGG